MARRPSVVSVTSQTSSLISPNTSQSVGSPDAFAHGKPVAWVPQQSVSLASKMDTIVTQNGLSNDMEPDELFAKYTVFEIKAIQQRLRTDADAKQEELRLMVGARYRDLLQASTSIVSISQSSDRVLEALEEMRNVVRSTDLPRTPKLVAGGQEDNHLQALQSLSAHMKLLLDAPEHLWRLMERRAYLHAAWLFLLSRVVHRVLARDEDEDEENWRSYGIEVSEKIPLVQRQWDAVSQFRSQITHKATLFLREHTSSSGETCATLLTLHLLESRPLPETLSIFLAQRLKTLSTLLSHTQGHGANGTVAGTSGPAKKISFRVRRGLVKDTRRKLQAVLEVVSRTLGTARVVFDEVAPDQVCMMRRALQYIQTEQTHATNPLPTELQLTTHTLLTGLPSSTHFLLLPPSIRTFKPYVDSASLLSSIPHSQLHQKLDTWFRKAAEDIQRATEKWFSELENIREVWDVRTAICDWLRTADGLDGQEKAHLKYVVDDASQRQVNAVWKSALALAEDEFQCRLIASITAFQDSSERSLLDASPVDYLFQPPPTPAMFQTGISQSLAAASFQRYKSALKRQVAVRTPLLDEVLTTAERHAQGLQDDLQALRGEDEDSRSLIARLIANYRPNAESLCRRVADILENAASGIADNSDASMLSLVFIARIADEFSASSTFVTRLGCDSSAISDFQTRMASLYDHTIERWKEYAVQRIVPATWSSGVHSLSHPPEAESHPPIRPSAILMQALLSLSSFLQQLAVPTHLPQQRHLVGSAVRSFMAQLLDHLGDAEAQSPQHGWQELYDLTFLRQIASMWEGECVDVVHRLDERIVRGRHKLHATEVQLDLEAVFQDQLFRTQILLASLLPPLPSPSASVSRKKPEKTSSLLYLGLPAVEQQFQPAVELAKPSPRFGLLLVGSTAIR